MAVHAGTGSAVLPAKPIHMVCAIQVHSSRKIRYDCSTMLLRLFKAFSESITTAEAAGSLGTAARVIRLQFDEASQATYSDPCDLQKSGALHQQQSLRTTR